jgi:hypothetical protein
MKGFEFMSLVRDAVTHDIVITIADGALITADGQMVVYAGGTVETPQWDAGFVLLYIDPADVVPPPGYGESVELHMVYIPFDGDMPDLQPYLEDTTIPDGALVLHAFLNPNTGSWAYQHLDLRAFHQAWVGREVAKAEQQRVPYTRVVSWMLHVPAAEGSRTIPAGFFSPSGVGTKAHIAMVAMTTPPATCTMVVSGGATSSTAFGTLADPAHSFPVATWLAVPVKHEGEYGKVGAVVEHDMVYVPSPPVGGDGRFGIPTLNLSLSVADTTEDPLNILVVIYEDV